MNVLFITGLSIAVAVVVGLNQFNALQAVRGENERLRQSGNALQAEVSESARAWTNAELSVSHRRASLQESRDELTKLAGEVNEAVLASPETEGSWPQSKGYFYLAKEYLGDVGYRPFTGTFELHTQAARLLGLTPHEERNASQACLNFRKQVEDLRFGASERVEPATDANNANHREIEYRIGAKTNEFLSARLEFENELRRSIGNTRADLFLQRVSSTLGSELYGQYGLNEHYVAYVADIEADGTVRHRVRVETLDRRTKYWFPVLFPIEPGSHLWKYRHLFGDQPLIPLPPEYKGE